MEDPKTTAEKTEAELENSKDSKPHVPPMVRVKTIVLVFTWISFGMANSTAGSTVPDMRTRLGVNMEEYSRTFAAMSIGGMIGAPLGVIGDRYSNWADLILSTCLLVAATAFTLRPWSMYLWVLTLLSFIEGIAWTCLNSIGNSMIMSLWGDDGNAPMHLLHFGYPLGAVIGPLIAAVYVSDEQTNSTTTSVPPYENSTDFYLNQDTFDSDDSRFEDESQIEIAYGIVGLIVAANSVVFLFFQIFRSRYTLSTEQTKVRHDEKYSWREVLSPTKWGAGDKKFGLTIVLLVMAFYFFLVATFKTSTTFYVPYAADSSLGFSNSEAAIYNSIISFAGTMGRACSIVAAKFVAIQPMIFVEVYGMVAATTLMAFWGHKDVTGYWVCSLLVVFFRDPIWPSAMTWADKYVVLFAIVVGLSDMSSKSADALFAWVLGYMYEYVSMESMFYFSVVWGILLCILLVIMHLIASRHGSRYDKEKLTAEIDLPVKALPTNGVTSVDNLIHNEQSDFTESTHL